MKSFLSIQSKAAFLTVVFLLNTIVGFACAISTDMGIKNDHHRKPEISVHSHKHDNGHKHEHRQPAADHHAPKKSKDNCCKEEVAKLTKADKLQQSSFDYSLLSLPSFILPVALHNFRSTSGIVSVNIPNSYFARHCRPPIADVRIAIQSFQI
ncbi:MAG: hypothetical protein WKF66_03870 [Pedobacter sp.]